MRICFGYSAAEEISYKQCIASEYDELQIYLLSWSRCTCKVNASLSMCHNRWQLIDFFQSIRIMKIFVAAYVWDE